MVIARRTFLIGLEAVITTSAFDSNEFVGEIAKGILPSPLSHRRIVDMTVSSMPTGKEIRAHEFLEDPVCWTFLRDDEPFYIPTINPRASLRWVAVPGAEIEISKKQILRVIVEPCHTLTTINIVSDIEMDRNPLVRRKMFSECFRWENSSILQEYVAACDPLDACLLVKS